MMSKWQVSSQYINGEKIFQVYRRRDVNEVDHAGNREYFDGTFDNKAAAQAVADKLNEGGNNEV